MPLNSTDSKLLQGIFVDPNIEIPKEFTQGNLAGNSAMAGAGLVGVLIGTILQGVDDSQNAKFSLQKVVIDNNIHIDEILRDRVQDFAHNHPRLSLSDREHAVSVLKLSVSDYGVSKAHPLGMVQHVRMRVSAKLEDLNGRLVWQEASVVSGSASDNDNGQTLETYSTSPTALRDALTTASQLLVAKLGDSLTNPH